MLDWKDIHPDFGNYWNEDKKVSWQGAGFDVQQTKEWLDAGLKLSQSEIAAYAKWKGYHPSSVNASNLRKEYYQVQNWLNYYYPLEGEARLRPNEGKERGEIKSLNINNNNLEGSLNLEGFVNLEEFRCRDNKLINIELSSCLGLKTIDCAKNKLTYLGLVGLKKLAKIYCSENQIADLKLYDCLDLEKIDCGNNSFISIEFLTQLPQPQKLEELNISDNYFSSQDLSFLASLINLKELTLVASRFFGSLQPLQKLTKLETLNINNNNLEGSLNLENFTNLKRFFCINNKISGLDISNCLQLRRFNCYNNQIASLDISKNLWLVNFICSENQITNLKLGKNDQLTEFCCWGNQLVDLDLSSLNLEKLERLDISNNNFSEQNLSLFDKFVNLKYLTVGTFDEENIKQDIYNRFSGSLQPLQNMNKLEELDISNTDINEGVEFLPSGIKEIYYSTEERLESKLKEISWQLKLFESKNQKDWENLDFTLDEIKLWIEVGLEVDDYKFANYLKMKKNLTSQKISQQVDKLRDEYEKSINQQFQNRIQIDYKKN